MANLSYVKSCILEVLHSNLDWLKLNRTALINKLRWCPEDALDDGLGELIEEGYVNNVNDKDMFELSNKGVNLVHNAIIKQGIQELKTLQSSNSVKPE